MKKLVLSAFVAALLASCGGQAENNAPAGDTAMATPASDTSALVEYFGEKITEDSAIAITELKSLMGDKTEIQVKLSGKIEAVCQKKGCWMELTNEGAEPLRVVFKDYGFFMPKDASGRTAIIQGRAYIDVTSVADLKEYAKDAGKSSDEVAQITEPKKELAFEASGVILK
ncbi:MAG: DUF4920 domain-containing protein [Bacteroidetes bacterium]|nr:DUF4920 domain-containing protein [Bacteroidota bacterium]